MAEAASDVTLGHMRAEAIRNKHHADQQQKAKRQHFH